MRDLEENIRVFRQRKDDRQRDTVVMVTLLLLGRLDLATVLASPAGERRHVLVRVERLLERERLRGARRHWSYDLNRHIALKQARDRLRETLPCIGAPPRSDTFRQKRRRSRENAALKITQ